MQGLFLASHVARLDARAMSEQKLSSLQLMDRAVDCLWKAMSPFLPSGVQTVQILVGPGNNGGDALGLARKFLEAGLAVEVFTLNEGKTPEWKAQRQRLPGMGATRPLETFAARPGTLVIDGIFGAGFHGELPASVRLLSRNLRRTCEVGAATSAGKPHVWAVDVPSGVDGDRAAADEDTLVCERTFCIGAMKYAVVHPALRSYCGTVSFVDIGLPQDHPDLWLMERAWVKDRLPARRVTDHKGTHGRLQVIGGYRGTPGAGILAARAAFKAGCGYVYVLSNDPTWIVGALPEVVVKQGEVLDAAIIGPGMGQSEDTVKELKRWIAMDLPLVIDGDGLNMLAALGVECIQGRKNTVLTPHPLEMARLMKTTVETVNNHRVNALRDFAGKLGVSVVLKGAGTLVSDGALMTLNATGNEGMATAGQGDALSGIIGALLADHLSASEAARVGVYLHGAAGDDVAQRAGSQGILAHEVADALPHVMEKLRMT